MKGREAPSRKIFSECNNNHPDNWNNNNGLRVCAAA